MVQSGGFLVRFLGPVLKTGLHLIKNVINLLAKSVLIPSGLTAVASTADAGIHKKNLGWDRCHSSSLVLCPLLRDALHKPTTLIISYDDMKDFIEIVESLEYSGLLPEGVSKTIQNEAKEQKEGFLGMLLGTLGASLLGNILTGKGINRAGEGILKADYGNKKGRKATTKRQDHKNKCDF